MISLVFGSSGRLQGWLNDLWRHPPLVKSSGASTPRLVRISTCVRKSHCFCSCGNIVQAVETYVCAWMTETVHMTRKGELKQACNTQPFSAQDVTLNSKQHCWHREFALTAWMIWKAPDLPLCFNYYALGFGLLRLFCARSVGNTKTPWGVRSIHMAISETAGRICTLHKWFSRAPCKAKEIYAPPWLAWNMLPWSVTCHLEDVHIPSALWASHCGFPTLSWSPISWLGEHLAVLLHHVLPPRHWFHAVSSPVSLLPVLQLHWETGSWEALELSDVAVASDHWPSHLLKALQLMKQTSPPWQLCSESLLRRCYWNHPMPPFWQTTLDKTWPRAPFPCNKHRYERKAGNTLQPHVQYACSESKLAQCWPWFQCQES